MSGTFKSNRLILLLLLVTTASHAALAQSRGPAHRGAQQRPMPGRPPARYAAVRPTNHQTPAPTPPTTTVYEGPVTVHEQLDGACDTCEQGTVSWGEAHCGPTHCLPIWGGVEYLLWWESDASYPALVTTSPNGTPRDDAGILGLASTSTLFGGDGQSVDPGTLSGGRLTLGLWLDPCQQTSIVGRGFGIEEHGTTYSAVSNGDSILARPFFNAFTDEPDALLLGFPGQIRGNIQIAQDVQTQGAQVFFRQLWKTGYNYRWDFVYGYRYLGVDDSLQINSSLEFIDPTGNSFGNTIDQVDIFDLENDFHGGELGLMGHSVDGRWSLDFLATVALGSMRQRATVRGSTTAAQPGLDPVVTQGGLLTQETNIGTFKDDPFTVVPEFTATLGYMITPRLDLTIGYTFLYVNHVSRAGQVIDTSVNLTQQTGNLEGPARPAFTFDDSDYWLQGLNFGLNLRY